MELNNYPWLYKIDPLEFFIEVLQKANEKTSFREEIRNSLINYLLGSNLSRYFRRDEESELGLYYVYLGILL
jgi:hypothetical protein